MPKRISLWLIWGWFIASCLDSLLPHHPVYRADPVTGSILISLALAVNLTALQIGIQYLTTKKQKLPNVDRGKVDDIRASVPGYGEFIPKIWGLARIAPIWVWESPAVDHPVTTPGHSGGKMPTGGGGTPTTVDHVYLKSVAGIFHDGQLYGKQPVRRIWFDTDLVASFITAELSAVRYEAEFGVLSGGAAVATQAECSGGKKVTGIGSGGKCTITVTTLAESYELAVHYTSLTDLTYKVYIDGVLLGDLVCVASGAATIVAIATYSSPIVFTAGDHLIRFENSGAACPDLDGIDLASAFTLDPIETRHFTSIVDVNRLPPENQDFGWAYFNHLPDPGDGGGAGGATGTPASTFNLGKYGQPSIRIYRGTRTQLADSAIVAQEGADSASAYRGFGYIVIEGIQLQGARMPNVTLEVDQGIHSVPAIVRDIYSLVAITPDQLDVTALNGLTLGDTNIDPGTYASANWQNKTNTTSGSNGAITKTSGADLTYNAGASHNGTLAASTNGAIRFTASLGAFSMGFSTSASPTNTSHILFGLQCHHSDLSSNNRLTLQAVVSGNNGTIDIGAWAPGDVFQIEIRNGKFRAYQNGIELGGFTPPVASFPLYPAFIAYSSGAGVTATSVSLAGAIGEEPSSGAGGLLLSSRRSAGDLLSDLQTRFQFDMVEVDGVVKAVLRNTATSDITIPYTDMRAVIVEPGSLPELPAFDCQISDLDPFLLPARVDVNYLDPGMDYHNNTQSDFKLDEEPQQDNQSVSLAIIDSADNMKRLAITLRSKAIMEGRTFVWQTSWKYMHVHPGSVATLTLPNATHTVRVVQAKYQIPAGVIEFSGVRQAASLYSPTATGSISSGYERPIAAIPANTKAVIIDGPLLRPEDAGDGTQPVVYIAMCGRGAGAWQGAFFYQEFPRGSGNFAALLTSANQASQIGVTSGALASVTDVTAFDTVSTLTINFYTATVLESVTEAELIANPELNLLAIVTPSGEVEYVQFQTAAAGTPASPYLAQYDISNFYRGRVGTDNNVGVHTSSDDVVVIDSTIKPRRMAVADVGIELKFKAVTSGQSSDDVPVLTHTLRGQSLAAAPPTQITVYRDADDNVQLSIPQRDDQVIKATKYWVDILAATGVTFTADASTNFLTSTAHGLVDGQEIAVANTGGALPVPLVKTKRYFVRDKTANTFKLALTVGGAAIDLTTNGTGTNKFSIIERHMPVIPGVFNQAILEEEGTSTETAGSGGWLKTITSTHTNTIAGDGSVATGSTSSGLLPTRTILGLITEPGASVEATWSSYDPKGAWDIAKNSAITVESEDGLTNYFVMKFVGDDAYAGYGGSSYQFVSLSLTQLGGATLTDMNGELIDTRYRFQFSGSELRISRNHADAGSVLVFRSSVPPVYPVQVRLSLSQRHKFSHITIGGLPVGLTTYPASDQVVDLGSAPATLRFRVYEEREFAGVTFLGDVTDFTT